MAKELLSRRGVPYVERDVAADPRAAQEVMEISGQMGVPVIKVDGQVMVGFDARRLEQLISGSTGQARPSFGLKIADASKIAMRQGAIPVFGAYVGGVREGSSAAKAGLRAGDIITEINMQPVSNANDLERVLKNLQPGSRVTLIFLRGDKTLRAEVTV